MSFAIKDLRQDRSAWRALLAVNNANARETSVLASDKFVRMIATARVGTFIEPAAAFLLAFAHDDAYDGGHFLWFRERFERFLYVDRVVVAEGYRRRGLGRLLYGDLFHRSSELGCPAIACEVNVQPPNPTSDAFHADLGFRQVGTATFDDGAKTVRYLVRQL
jgi:predicted GNAT superfamily acetyltransferase